jgi:phosphatidate cytidylyltransferase
MWLAGSVIAVLLAQLTRADDPKPLASVGASLHIILYLGVLFSFMHRLVLLGEPDGRYLGVWLILVVKACDTGAYFTGRSIGKHKLIPRLSPGKTWEGCAGGVVTSVLAGLAMWHFQGGELDGIELPLAFALLVPMLLAVLGICGDLMESQLKRALAVKDSGELLRGMGGILDVVDSLLPTTPVLYFCLYALLEWFPR